MLLATALAWGKSNTEDLAKAIARAEGFGASKTNLPTRCHNPGDIRSVRGVHFPGQVGLNKRGYVIFKSDAAGWAALYHQIDKIIAGESRFYTADMTLKQLSKKYATDPRWVKNVAKFLGVTPSITLAELLDIPPVIQFVSNSQTLDSMLIYSASLPSFNAEPLDENSWADKFI
jgi:hypothetical protein